MRFLIVHGFVRASNLLWFETVFLFYFWTVIETQIVFRSVLDNDARTCSLHLHDGIVVLLSVRCVYSSCDRQKEWWIRNPEIYFRYYVLIKPTPRSRSVALVCIVYYVPTALIFVSFLKNYTKSSFFQGCVVWLGNRAWGRDNWESKYNYWVRPARKHDNW